MYKLLINTKRPLFAAYFVLVCFVLSACTQEQDIQTQIEAPQVSNDLEFALPEDVGMDSQRLERLTAAMQDLVDDGLLAGSTTMISRHNKIIHFETAGMRDIEANSAMAEDTLFRIYSMTKPITGVALMTLYEEGKFNLSDPVEKYIPQFSNLQVASGVDSNGEIITEAPNHKMTIRELMSHTGGLSYGLFSQSAVDDLYNQLGILNFDNTLQESIELLSTIPLRQQPGSMWHYSVSVDVQGYLIEVLTDQPFNEVLQERIFEPLGMRDTDFYAPPEKINRFAQVYDYDENGNLIIATEGIVSMFDYIEYPNLLSGGGGLVSSTMDYMRFSQMLLNGGELDGVRILSPLTVDLMSSNQLPQAIKTQGSGPGLGFGLDFAITLDAVEAESYSEGEYYWGGAAGTWFWIDPVEDLVFVGMIQQFGGALPDVRSLSRKLTYQAIVEPNEK